MQFEIYKDKVLIVDFGSQVTKLIARRVRELGIYSEIITPNDLIKLKIIATLKDLYSQEDPQLLQVKNSKVYLKNYLKKKFLYWEYVMVYS